MKQIEIIKGCFIEEIIIDGIDSKIYPREKIIEWLTKSINNTSDAELMEILIMTAWIKCDNSESIYNTKCDTCNDYNSKINLNFEIHGTE